MSSRPRFVKFPSLKVPGSNMFKKGIGRIGFKSKEKESKPTDENSHFPQVWTPDRKAAVNINPPEYDYAPRQQSTNGHQMRDNRNVHNGYAKIPVRSTPRSIKRRVISDNLKTPMLGMITIEETSTIKDVIMKTNYRYTKDTDMRIDNNSQILLFILEHSVLNLFHEKDYNQVCNTDIWKQEGLILIMSAKGQSINDMIHLVDFGYKINKLLEGHALELDIYKDNLQILAGPTLQNSQRTNAYMNNSRHGQQTSRISQHLHPPSQAMHAAPNPPYHAIEQLPPLPQQTQPTIMGTPFNTAASYTPQLADDRTRHQSGNSHRTPQSANLNNYRDGPRKLEKPRLVLCNGKAYDNTTDYTIDVSTTMTADELTKKIRELYKGKLPIPLSNSNHTIVFVCNNGINTLSLWEEDPEMRNLIVSEQPGFFLIISVFGKRIDKMVVPPNMGWANILWEKCMDDLVIAMEKLKEQVRIQTSPPRNHASQKKLLNNNGLAQVNYTNHSFKQQRSNDSNFGSTQAQQGDITLPIIFNGADYDNTLTHSISTKMSSTVTDLNDSIIKLLPSMYGDDLTASPYRILFVSKDNCTNLAKFPDVAKIKSTTIRGNSGYIAVISANGCSIDEMITQLQSDEEKEAIKKNIIAYMEQYKRDFEEFRRLTNTTESVVPGNQNVLYESMIGGHSLQTTRTDSGVSKDMGRNEEAQSAGDEIRVPVFCNTRGKVDLSYVTLHESLTIGSLTADVEFNFKEKTGEEFENIVQKIVYVSADNVFEILPEYVVLEVGNMGLWTQKEAAIVVISANGLDIKHMLEQGLAEDKENNVTLLVEHYDELVRYKAEVDRQQKLATKLPQTFPSPRNHHNGSGSGLPPPPSTTVPGSDNRWKISRQGAPPNFGSSSTNTANNGRHNITAASSSSHQERNIQTKPLPQFPGQQSSLDPATKKLPPLPNNQGSPSLSTPSSARHNPNNQHSQGRSDPEKRLQHVYTNMDLERAEPLQITITPLSSFGGISDDIMNQIPSDIIAEFKRGEWNILFISDDYVYKASDYLGDQIIGETGIWYKEVVVLIIFNHCLPFDKMLSSGRWEEKAKRLVEARNLDIRIAMLKLTPDSNPASVSGSNSGQGLSIGSRAAPSNVNSIPQKSEYRSSSTHRPVTPARGKPSSPPAQDNVLKIVWNDATEPLLTQMPITDYTTLGDIRTKLVQALGEKGKYLNIFDLEVQKEVQVRFISSAGQAIDLSSYPGPDGFKESCEWDMGGFIMVIVADGCHPREMQFEILGLTSDQMKLFKVQNAENNQSALGQKKAQQKSIPSSVTVTNPAKGDPPHVLAPPKVNRQPDPQSYAKQARVYIFIVRFESKYGHLLGAVVMKETFNYWTIAAETLNVFYEQVEAEAWQQVLFTDSNCPLGEITGETPNGEFFPIDDNSDIAEFAPSCRRGKGLVVVQLDHYGQFGQKLRKKSIKDDDINLDHPIVKELYAQALENLSNGVNSYGMPL